ncbi:MAG: HesA/MoeB/ThiF family protein [Candidatus Hecatellaceae archaeon]
MQVQRERCCVMVKLSRRELERYDRQLRIGNFGVKAQRKLKKARVVVAGVGGLGCSAALYLVAAGVGKLTLIDREKVELSNLNRQILHWTKDVGRYKVDSALEKLSQLNPDIEVEGLKTEINGRNVFSLIENADVVVDGMDSFKARLLLNRACIRLGKPFVHAAVYGLMGELMTVLPSKGPCYQCYVTPKPREVKTPPVLGATPGVMGCLEAVEALKLITGVGSPLVGELLIFDGLQMSFRTVKIVRLKGCPACGKPAEGK